MEKQNQNKNEREPSVTEEFGEGKDSALESVISEGKDSSLTEETASGDTPVPEEKSASEASEPEETSAAESASGAEEPSSLSGKSNPPESFGREVSAQCEETGYAGSGKTGRREEDRTAPAGSPGAEQFGSVWNVFWETFSKRYWQFDGRANRTEFWVFFIGSLIVNAVLQALIGIPILGVLAFFAWVAWSAATIIPTWAVAFRRLHDTGRTGWWISGPLIAVFLVLFLFPLSVVFTFISLIAAVPVCVAAGALFVVALCFCALPGDEGKNGWGEPPADLGIF